MALLNSRVSNFIQGVNQQDRLLRSPGQVTECVNFVPDVVDQLTRRRGTELIARIRDNADSDPVVHIEIINPVPDKYYVAGIFRNTAQSRNYLRIWDITGEEKLVGTYRAHDLSPDAYTVGTDIDDPMATYCSDIDDVYKFITAGYSTFLLNTNKRTTVDPISDPVGILIENAKKRECLVWLKQVGWNTTYTLTINGITHSLTAPDGTGENDLASEWLSYEWVLTKLLNELNISLQSNTGISLFYSIRGPVAYLAQMGGANWNIHFTVEAKSSTEGSLAIIYRTVSALTEIPEWVPFGYILEVTGGVSSNAGNYWVIGSGGYENIAQVEFFTRFNNTMHSDMEWPDHPSSWLFSELREMADYENQYAHQYRRRLCDTYVVDGDYIARISKTYNNICLNNSSIDIVSTFGGIDNASVLDMYWTNKLSECAKPGTMLVPDEATLPLTIDFYADTYVTGVQSDAPGRIAYGHGIIKTDDTMSLVEGVDTTNLAHVLFHGEAMTNETSEYALQKLRRYNGYYRAEAPQQLYTELFVHLYNPDTYGTPADYGSQAFSAAQVICTRLFEDKYLCPRWSIRGSGDLDTNPTPAWLGSKISNIQVYKNRLLLFSGNYLNMSAADGFYRFYKNTATTFTDSDPIELSTGAANESRLYSSTELGGYLYVFGRGGQYVLKEGEVLSPKNSYLSYLSSYDFNQHCQPLSIGKQVIFAANDGQHSQIFEALNNLYTDVLDIDTPTAGLPTYIAKDIRRITGYNPARMVILHSKEAPNQLYLYKYYWAGNDKKQNAWCKLTFNYDIEDVMMHGDILYILSKGRSNNSLFIEQLDLSGGSDEGHYIDRYSQSDISDVNSSGTYICTNMPYMSSVKPTIPAFRPQGETAPATTSGRYTLRKLQINYSGFSFTVRVSNNLRAAADYICQPVLNRPAAVVSDIGITHNGTFDIPIFARDTEVTIEIFTDAEYPCHILSGAWEATYTTWAQLT